MNEDEILKQAAKPTVRRMRADRERYPEQAELLQRIETRLFVEGFGVKALKKFCGKNAERRLADFQADLGETAESYISGARLEIGSRLLTDSTPTARRISELLGYRELTTFRKPFQRWFGMGLDEFRKLAKAAQVNLGPPASMLNLEERKKAIGGKLPPRDGKALVCSLHALYSKPNGYVDLAPRVLEELIEWLIKQPSSVQRYLLRHEIACGSAALFEYLSEKSRSEGRRDHKRGLDFAELALLSVEGSASVLGDHFEDFRALALARLANARRLVCDYRAAEDALRQVEAAWKPTGQNPRLQAEIWLIKGTLRLFQRRFAEALEMFDVAIENAEEAGDGRLEIHALLQHVAVTYQQGKRKTTNRYLQRALHLADQLDENELLQQVTQNMVGVAIEFGDFPQARQYLPKAKALAEGLGRPSPCYQLQWLEGQLHIAEGNIEDAETCFCEAKQGFDDLAELNYVGELALALALLYLEQGRSREALALVCTDVIPVFEMLSVHREALAALKLLQEAVVDERISVVLLEHARDYLTNLRQDPVRNLRRLELGELRS